jgi:hypothetical protein
MNMVIILHYWGKISLSCGTEALVSVAKVALHRRYGDSLKRLA